MAREMEKARKATSPKSSTINTGPKSPVRNGGGSPPHKNTAESRGRKNEQQNVRKGGQDLMSDDEGKRRSSTSQTSPKRSPRHEQPLSYLRLHTEERAIRRAGFNYQIASKINTQEIIRRFEEKLAQVMEEREIKMMRKEMVPKAQLMPAFDKPFHPQRSTRPLTVPKEPSFLRLKCCIGGEFHRHFCYNAKAMIK
ncbi:microtubule-destabilizing protein 60-like [Phragmites australis]|uniref:microtubule-destabilizing protein 60-like n=1 Tax=Phragmites australis TaxID=29695 RepID=UPI002D7771E6|nr:microtubule-destabilizing protein 60-like [Phragmites australis]